jgi:hypothetical protein
MQARDIAISTDASQAMGFAPLVRVYLYPDYPALPTGRISQELALTLMFL